jgi:hypothetical protein
MPEDLESQWYAWGQRHSLRACASGGIFPNVYIRGAGDKVEFSWGNANFSGYPNNLYFTVPSGTTLLSRNYVSPVLKDFVSAATRELSLKNSVSERINALETTISSIECSDEKYIEWMIPAVCEQHIKFSELLALIKERMPDMEFSSGIPAPVLMFGSCSPNIQRIDIDKILNGIQITSAKDEFGDYASSIPFLSGEQPYMSGYSAAEDFLEKYPHGGDFIDIESILEHFSIKTMQENFLDGTIRGIALTGNKLAPTVSVNINNSHNRSDTGRRYTLAHEFCHLLHDRQYVSEVGIVSGPWAPMRVEQRADAFAAMLLMPIEYIKHLKGRTIEFADVQETATQLCVGKSALIEHLHNLGFMSMPERDALREQNSGRAA